MALCSLDVFHLLAHSHVFVLVERGEILGSVGTTEYLYWAQTDTTLFRSPLTSLEKQILILKEFKICMRFRRSVH